MTNGAEFATRGFFTAMQAGAAAEEDMMALFADDAVYTEPFTGTPRTHTGKVAIRNTMREAWSNPLPAMKISVDRLHLDADKVTAEWTCRSPALPDGEGRGTNVFTLRNGLIARLETTFRAKDK